MNKKTLFLILLSAVLISPLGVLADVIQVPQVMANIQTAVVTIGTSIVVIGWVIAGILYLTAAGSPEKIGIAKKALFACVIGTALVVLASVAQQTICQLLSGGAAGQCK